MRLNRIVETVQLFSSDSKNKHTCYFLYIEGVSLIMPKKFASLESLAASLANPWNLKVNTKCVCSIFPTNANICISIVDGSTAGSGNLEILVNGGHVTSYVRELGDQCFLASFVPHQATVHTIEVIKRNNKSITTSIETCNCFFCSNF